VFASPVRLNARPFKTLPAASEWPNFNYGMHHKSTGTSQNSRATIAELKTTVAQQQKEIAAQQATAAQQQKQIEALTATVRKVNERVELSAPALRIAASDD
jgi:hypothetical protein